MHVRNSGTDAFAGQKVDGVRPTFSHAATSLDGASVVVTFSENIQATTAVNDDFTVTVAGTEATLTGSPSVSDRAVTLTVGTAITAGQTVTVAYTDPSADDDTAAVQDAAGNDAASFAAQTVTNGIGASSDATLNRRQSVNHQRARAQPLRYGVRSPDFPPQ